MKDEKNVFSNHWKSRMGGTASQRRFFQSLEVFQKNFPTIGNFFTHFSNHWKVLVLTLFSYFIFQTSTLFSNVPQPMCIFYGQALDGFGWPYQNEGVVLLYHGTNEVTSYEITQPLSPGVNFALNVYLYDDAINTNAYVPYALRTGDVVTIKVEDSYGVKTIMETNAVPPVGNPGDILRINVTAGVDSDGDGLPDEFEREMLAYSTNSAISTIEDIRPEDDFDGDGVSNGDEYHSGNFAFLDYDYFRAESFSPAADGRLCIEFISVPGKAYSLMGTEDLTSGVWTNYPWALSSTNALQTGAVSGTGQRLRLYVPTGAGSMILRLDVE